MRGNPIKSISIIGDGGWGTALAIHLAQKGYKVTLWGAFAGHIAAMAASRENKEFLPGHKIPPSVFLTADIHQAIGPGDLVVLACPSEYLQGTLAKIKTTAYRAKIFLSVIKGIHPKSFGRMTQMIERHLGKVPLAVLSGPTIAGETAAGKATTAVVACADLSLARAIQKVFHSAAFRIYTNTDVAGVEIGGSVKNVIAIACGVCDGLGLGTNAKSAILTRGLAEITRLGIALGGRKETFYGLSGLGDLATTCFSPSSRNRTVGEALGRGKGIKSILGKMHAIAEGVVTAKAVYRLSRARKIPMPIVEQVYKIIFQRKNPRKAMADLMGRQVKAE
ncbi:MAG: NAD(P)-dependent glycerol-3-phosphate dehydrogenase [Candidatus Omnitrophica bacterium]|nr:NAD(P)-dependent glycerol-3-phosphate dehydrogenase [Candidatus Omnitrophota bacterium]